MMKIKRLNKKKMTLNEMLIYIKENSPKKIKSEKTIDRKNEKGVLIKRDYIVVDQNDITNEFVLECIEGDMCLTHIYINPYNSLDLEDDII